MRPNVLLAVLAAVAASVLSVSGASARPVKEGGTFRMAITTGIFGSIDPALYGLESRILRPACAALMSYPDKPLPAGLRLTPELAKSYPIVSRDRRTYTFTLRRDARFSDGSPLSARDFVHTLERLFDPKMNVNGGSFADIVGGRAMLAGKATSLAGVVAKGRTLILRLTRPVLDLEARTSGLCVVPSALPADPEGAKAPLPSPGPYYVSEYAPGERLVLERNRFYRGQRPHHLDRIEVDLAGEPSAVDDVASGRIDSVAATPDLSSRLAGLVRRYGINKSRLFVSPDVLTQMFVMNTRRPLFRDNIRLRQALNFAVDRRAVVREFGPYAATASDQYLPPVMPGFRDERIYPLKGADPRKARALARGHTRSRVAVLYTCSERLDCIGAAQVLQRNLKAIGLEVRIKRFPLQLMFRKLSTPGEPFDLAWVGWVADWNDPQSLFGIFDGRMIGQPGNGNWSYFNEAKYNRLLGRAARLSGARREQAYGDLDVQLARDAAPAIAVFNRNTWAFVSARTGCVVMNPALDLTAACLK